VNVDRLMDSIKVRSELDAFVAVWGKKRTSDAEKAVRLEAMLEAVMGAMGGAAPMRARSDAGEVMRSTSDHIRRQERPESMERNFTPEEAAEARAEDEANKPMPMVELMDWAYERFAKGKRKYRDGFSVIGMPIQDKATGRMVPMEGWEDYFKAKGIPVTGMETRIDAPNGRFELMWG
jgi:hypothetical protein